MNNAPQTLVINIWDAELPYLYYHGRGRAVVMLHATGFLPWLWHPIARALAGDYRLIAPYFCDYRESDPASGLSWTKLAEDLCQMCDRLNIASPVMVGHSMGATVMTIAEATHSLGAAGMILIEPIFYLRNIINSIFAWKSTRWRANRYGDVISGKIHRPPKHI
jgi:pimeloyl-ACP methyl ester carboxylesterase